MKRRFVNTAIAMIMLLSLAAAIPLALPAPVAQANGGCTPPPAGTWYVDDNGAECAPYCYNSTIQEAIDAASAGDTIIVYNGTYNNANLTIDKPLTIISQNGSASTFINGGGSGIAVSIDASNVTFGTAGHGFTVTFGGQPGIAMYPNDGTEMTGISIVDNIIHDCTQAIVFEFEGTDGSYDFHNNAITDNTIYNCNWAMWFDTSHEETYIRDNTITGNTIYNCWDGIHFYNDNGTGDIYGNTITGNTIHDYLEAGIIMENDGQNSGPEGIIGDIRSNNVSANTVYNTSGDGEGGGGFGIQLVNAFVITSGNVSDNTVTGNEVYNCSDTGIYIDNWMSAGNVAGNNVSDNTVYECYYGIALESSYGGALYDNIVTGNVIHDCTSGDGDGTGILLWAYNSDVYGNTVDGNTVWDCDNGIELEGGELYDNAVTYNTVYCTDYDVDYPAGIFLYVSSDDGGYIHDCTVEDNTVYGCYYGIDLWDESEETIEDIDILHNVLYNGSTGNEYGISVDLCSYINIHGNEFANSHYGTGIEIYDSSYIYVTGNLLRDNYFDDGNGIYLYSSDYVDICGNDISDNDVYLAGIYSISSSDITVSCNNIEENYSYDDHEDIGISAAVSGAIDADYNWWGDSSGPGGDYAGYGDAAYGYVDIDYWLEEEVTLLPDSVIDYAAVPATVSLYDADGLFGSEYYEVDPIYTLGPSYTDIIVEVECQDENPCAIQYATVNLSALLLDMLPADFQQRYVDTWYDETQDDWYDWLDDLSEMEMDYYSTEDTCFFDFEFYLDDLLFYGWDCGGEEPDYPCDGLYDIFCDAYYGYDEGRIQLGALLFEELRLGDYDVPVTVYSCCDGEDCYNSYTVYVPLAVVDFQLPLEAGWNLRSTPVSLDTDYNTFTEILALGDGMPGLEALITYNASSGLWEEPGPSALVSPLSAYYIRMSGRDQMGFVVNRDVTAPPTRHLYAGWNLVSLAAPYTYYSYEGPDCWPFRYMYPWDALFPARYAAGGLTGWLMAMNPAEDLEYEESFYYKDVYLSSDSEDLPYKPPYYKYFYQESWLAFSDGDWSGNDYYGPFLTPGGGYWVFMENAADLAGYSYTPYPWAIWYD